MTEAVNFYKSVYENIKFDDSGNRVLSFTTVREEYNALKNGVGIRDISDSSLLEMRGKDCLDFLNRISTNLVKDIKTNRVASTIFTNENGGILDRVTVANLDNIIFLLGSSAYRTKLFIWINKYIIKEDIQISDHSAKYSKFEITGSQSRSFLSMFFGDLMDADESGFAFKVYFDRTEAYLIKKNEFGITKYIIICVHEDTQALLNFMQNHKSVFDLVMAGSDAYQAFRIKHGIPEAPAELNDNYNPHEVNLTDDISFSKGSYIGQKAVSRFDSFGKAKEILAVLVFDDEVSHSLWYSLFAEDNREAGIVTSIAKAIDAGKSIALAFIKKEFADEGTKLTAKDSHGQEFPVTVCCIPVKK
ncbi:MAG: glycine cleavage T C-terminal barrel domain-containing protein [Ignavibacteria bacterium]